MPIGLGDYSRLMTPSFNTWLMLDKLLNLFEIVDL